MNSYINGYKMEKEMVETRGYEFYWKVAPKGYEIVDKALYVCKQKPVSVNPLYRYSPNRLFSPLQLNTKRWDGELNPDAIDVSPPWLILKQGQSYSGMVYESPDPARVYNPLHDEPVLHRRFASLNTERLGSEVLQFAGRFGMLGRNINLNPVTPGIPIRGESLIRWRVEIEKMGVLLTIWDYVERKNNRLGQIVIWSSPEAVIVRLKWKSHKGKYEILPWSKEDLAALSDVNQYYEYERQSDYAYTEELLANDEVLPRDKKPSPFFKRYGQGEFLGPAHYYLCRMLNYHLHGITPRLTPWLGYKVAFMPDSLLDAIWLMFMLEVNGEVRTCWYCRGPLDPARKDKIYCSNNCKRMACYYKKQGKGGTK